MPLVCLPTGSTNEIALPIIAVADEACCAATRSLSVDDIEFMVCTCDNMAVWLMNWEVSVGFVGS